MNAQSLLDLVKRRVPGYDDSEYLSEINQAYSDVWEEIVKLDSTYFTDKQVLTVAIQQSDFDLLHNADGGFTGNVLSKLHQVVRVRVLPLNANGWFKTESLHVNDQDWLTEQQASQPGAQSAGPFFYIVTGKGTLSFGKPQLVGTQIEVTYEYGYFDMTTVSDGTVSSSAKVVTGTSTNFRSLLPPDYVNYMPGAGDVDLDIDAEIVVSGKTYEVASIASDTSLTLRTTPGTAFSTSSYVLASVPVFPAMVHNVIADIATRNMFSTPADDARFSVWAGIAAQSMEELTANVMKRQRQTNARKARFPFGAVRRGRYVS